MVLYSTCILTKIIFLCKNLFDSISYFVRQINQWTKELTHGGPVARFGDMIWVNIGSGNGLVPDSTKPLPEPMLTYHH